ncbi:hypothetical protein DE4585_04757 [Mycobacteroides salmoniphilum]|uniref:Uncharacterized protein n=1 Tax=Mycobacteroides salmoniphilum TaxID=404941 RepID=A0A4R8RWB3_9MYCO|nr:hypothetical protein [Mycobacteroides salmoniphilum]TDZ77363.1 hypothetical protein DE4585_04757 [Mycobacteroides salmoniphilum]
MSNTEPDAAAYRFAALQLAWEEFGPVIPVTSLTHCATVAAANGAWNLGGAFENPVTYLEVLFDRLASDPLAVAAADELDALGRVRAELWVMARPNWERIAERAVGIHVPDYTGIERFYRRAAVEHAVESYSFPADDLDLPKTSVIAFVEMFTAARVRWNCMGFELTACHAGDLDSAAKALVRDLIDADPILLAAEVALTPGWRSAAAKIVDEDWPSIRERAETLQTVSAIGATAAI